ncbi:hypothetical protein H6784_01230 [Candidatus Nomurabacteria bacterium]|nr:hypothetical protein [Candidatus Nomurabacteria bacterium]
MFVYNESDYRLSAEGGNRYFERIVDDGLSLLKLTKERKGMNVKLTAVGFPGVINGGTFYNYELEAGEETTFCVVRFLPAFFDSRETLTRIEAGEQLLFLAKDHLDGRDQLVFIGEVDGQWVIYRLTGMPHDATVDKVWLVTERGVHYPLDRNNQADIAEAVRLKRLIAVQEVCEVAFSAAEQNYELQRQQQERAAAAQRRQAEVKAAAEERRRKAVEAAAAAEARRTEKLRLQSLENRRSFALPDGKQLFGYVVSDQEVAKRLDDGKIAVILSSDGKRVIAAFTVNKTKGGKVSLTELNLAEATSRSAASAVSQQSTGGQSMEVPLGQLSSFQKRDEKRKPGDKPVVARHATREQLALLKANRPKVPVNVAVLCDDKRWYEVYQVSQNSIDTIGLMVRQATGEPATKTQSRQVAPAPKASRPEKSRTGQFMSV